MYKRKFYKDVNGFSLFCGALMTFDGVVLLLGGEMIIGVSLLIAGVLLSYFNNHWLIRA